MRRALHQSVLLLAAISLFAALPAQSSEANFGYISNVYVMANGAILFDTSGTRAGTVPTCVSNTPQRFAVDASTTAGQAMGAALFTAYYNKKRVIVSGTGTCSIWGDTETAQFIFLEN